MSEIDPNRPMVIASGNRKLTEAETRALVSAMLPVSLAVSRNRTVRGPMYRVGAKPEPKTEIEIWNAAVEAKKRAKKEAKA